MKWGEIVKECFCNNKGTEVLSHISELLDISSGAQNSVPGMSQRIVLVCCEQASQTVTASLNILQPSLSSYLRIRAQPRRSNHCEKTRKNLPKQEGRT